MNTNETDVFSKMIEKSDSAILLFFILIIFAFVIAIIPFYKAYLNDRTKRKETEELRYDKINQREAQLIEVITKNTEVLSELKTLFKDFEKQFSSFSGLLYTSIISLDEKTDKILTSVALIEKSIGLKPNEIKKQESKNKELD